MDTPRADGDREHPGIPFLLVCCETRHWVPRSVLFSLLAAVVPAEPSPGALLARVVGGSEIGL